MRRLALEFTKDDFSKFHGSVPFSSLKTMEVLQFLRLDMDELAAICRVEPEDDSHDFVDLMEKTVTEGNFAGAQVLEREKSGAYIVFVKHNPVPIDFGFSPLKINGGYLVSTEICEGKVRMTYAGTDKQIKSILEELKQHGPAYKILSLTDAKFSPNSPLNRLTEKQRKVLTTAYKLGYYSLPRKIDSEQLAKRLSIHKSALATHRRKAELRLITEVLKEHA